MGGGQPWSRWHGQRTRRWVKRKEERKIEGGNGRSLYMYIGLAITGEEGPVSGAETGPDSLGTEKGGSVTAGNTQGRGRSGFRAETGPLLRQGRNRIARP